MNQSETVDPNFRIFKLLILISVICQIIITPFFWGDPQLIVNWLSIPIYGALGYIGFRKYEGKANFPPMLSSDIDITHRYIIPVSLGIIYAIAAIIFDVFSENKIPQIKFPLSIFAYVPVGILDEMFWRLFIMTFGVYFLVEKYEIQRNRAFLVMVTIETIIYMGIQFSLYSKMVGSITPYVIFQVVFVSGSFIIIVSNLYRRYGFLTAIIMHSTQYILYHGLYGGISAII